MYLKRKCNKLIEHNLEKEEELKKLKETVRELEEEKNSLENRLLEKQEESDLLKETALEPADEEQLKRTVNKILVGITGSQARIGCTHLGIVIANYLRRKGYMVALLEYVSEQQSERKVFDEIQEAYQESLIDDRYFALNGIDYYARVSNEELQQLLSVKFYNFIIVDFGLYQNCDKLMYSKCDIRLLVSGAKPWETAHIGRVFKDTEQAALQQMSFVFNFVADSDREDIRREMSGLDKVYFLPLSDNPFSASDIGDMENIFAFYERQTTAETQRKKRSVMGFIRRKQSGKT